MMLLILSQELSKSYCTGGQRRRGKARRCTQDACRYLLPYTLLLLLQIARRRQLQKVTSRNSCGKMLRHASCLCAMFQLHIGETCEGVGTGSQYFWAIIIDE